MASANLEKLLRNLAQFSGSEEYYKYNFFGFPVHLTQGVKYLAETAPCFWLIDAILSHQGKAKVKKEPFQVWRLSKIGVNDMKFILSGDDGNGNAFAVQKIRFSDFPLDSIKLYFCDGVLMLPEEY